MRRLGMVLLSILFLFMVFAGPATQKADAVVVSTVVIGAVIAAMAAAGIGLTVSGMTSAQLQDWVSGKLNTWATSLGGSIQDHIDNNLITVTTRGILSVGTAAANGISDFISWLTNEDSIQDNSTQVIQGDYSLNGYKLGVLPISIMNATYRQYATSSGAVYYYMNHVNDYDGVSYYTYYFLSIGNTTVTTDIWSPQFQEVFTTNVNTLLNGWYYNSTRTGYTIGNNISEFDSSLVHNVYPTTVISGGGDATIDQGVAYETQTITVPTIQTNDKWFLDVGAVPGSTVQTVTDGVIADTIDGSLTVSGEVAEEEPEFEVTGPIGVSGLTEVFPFCIPFDVYALLSCLSAEPQTPIFTVRFVIPGVINQEFTIDLSPFSTIAQIVRTMELIAFAVGLALVTRERFLRS